MLYDKKMASLKDKIIEEAELAEKAKAEEAKKSSKRLKEKVGSLKVEKTNKSKKK